MFNVFPIQAFGVAEHCSCFFKSDAMPFVIGESPFAPPTRTLYCIHANCGAQSKESREAAEEITLWYYNPHLLEEL